MLKFEHESVNKVLNLSFEGNDFQSGIKVEGNVSVRWKEMKMEQFFSLIKSFSVQNGWLVPQLIEIEYFSVNDQCSWIEFWNLDESILMMDKNRTIYDLILEKGAIVRIRCSYELIINCVKYNISTNFNPSYNLNQLNIQSISRGYLSSKGSFFCRCKNASILQLIQHSSLTSNVFESCIPLIVDCKTVCVPRSFTVYQMLFSIHQSFIGGESESWMMELLTQFLPCNNEICGQTIDQVIKMCVLLMNKDGSTLSFASSNERIGETLGLKNFARVLILPSTTPDFIQTYLYNNPSICNVDHLCELFQTSHHLDYTSFAIWATVQFLKIYQSVDQFNQIKSNLKKLASSDLKGLPILASDVVIFYRQSLKTIKSSLISISSKSSQYLSIITQIHKIVSMNASETFEILEKIHCENGYGKLVQMDLENPKLRRICIKFYQLYDICLDFCGYRLTNVFVSI